MSTSKYLIAIALGVGLALSCVSEDVGARPINAEEKEYARLATNLWAAEGLPGITTDCRDPLDLFVVALDTKLFEERCGRAYCNNPELKDGELCAVACLSSTTTGCVSANTTVIMHKDFKDDINLYLHELMHRFSSCAGFGLDHGHLNQRVWHEILPELQMTEMDEMTDGGV
jgi:hypothetical protein